MADISFLDKLKVLIDVSSSSGLCIASIFIILFMAFIMITTNKKNAKGTKIFYGIVYLFLMVIIFVQYGSSLSSMFDYMMNNFFIAVYFPNLAIYLAAIVATNIILWKTVFNFKEDKLLKIINTIIYSIMHYVLVLILNIVTSNKLDVFDQSSIYGNKSVLALIGLSSTIFVVWIIFIIVYKIIRSKQKTSDVKVEVVEKVVKKHLPSNIIQVPTPKLVKGIIAKKKKAVEPVEVKQTSLVDFYQNNDLVKQYENMLTLEDYKLVLELLKNNKSNISKINTVKKEIKQPIKNTSYVNTRIEEKFDDEKVPTKLDQLLNIYKSV